MTHDSAVLLGLETIDDRSFRGMPTDAVPSRVFGGQLIAQALLACGRTVGADRPVNSLHAYFLRPGRPGSAVRYEVDALRDGRALSTRQVTAMQGDEAILSLSASFHEPEVGPVDQLAVMGTLDPIDDDGEVPDRSSDVPAAEQQWFTMFRSMFPFEIRFPDEPVRIAVRRGERPEPRQRVLLRWRDLPDDALTHTAALAFMSDALLLSTSVFPHGRLFGDRGVAGSSLDHAMWFHRPPRVDQWLVHEMESTRAGAARALCAGRFFTPDGELVASVAQEGLIRLEPPGTAF